MGGEKFHRWRVSITSLMTGRQGTIMMPLMVKHMGLLHPRVMVCPRSATFTKFSIFSGKQNEGAGCYHSMVRPRRNEVNYT